MAINETSVDGKKYRQKTADGWKWYSFITKAKDILFGDGDDADNNLETNLGSFKGITTSTSVTETGYAADATVVSQLNDSLGGFIPIIDSTGKITGYKTKVGADTVFPFKSMEYDVTTFTIGGGDFKSAYPCQAYDTLKVTTSGGNPQLTIYGVASMASTSGTTLKTITSNTTVSINVSNYDYVYFTHNSSQYLTIKITFE